MKSGIAWLSSSNAEIARARAALKALTPGGVIDELGFLVLQGAFADHFYPAVTTPMTRARYLVFIPAIYRYLEQSRKGAGKEVDRIARELQYRLLQALLKNEKTAIGREAGANLVQTPAEIYWSAIATLGIASQRVSERRYQEQLSAGEFGPRRWRDDDEAAHADETESLWNTDAPLSHAISEDGTFADSTSFRLRKTEAAFLRTRYGTLKPAGQPCLTSHLVALAIERGVDSLEAIEFPWQIPGLSHETGLAADNARRLSLFARGTTLQYHRMLIKRRGIPDPGVAEAFKAWWKAAAGDLAVWNLDEFFDVLRRWEANRRPVHDRRFLETWIQRCTSSKSGAGALEDTEAQGLIAEREHYVRRGRERLRVKYQLDSWRPFSSYVPDEIHQLQYRHRVGRQFAEDIATGLAGDAA